mmetsp:Transcript_91215/g.263178  ORF Transcript_91215/g.263178 Transcript_91215/m.263178 type:complete len:201 (-) Transcript_91215:254-856(-)
MPTCQDRTWRIPAPQRRGRRRPRRGRRPTRTWAHFRQRTAARCFSSTSMACSGLLVQAASTSSPRAMLRRMLTPRTSSHLPSRRCGTLSSERRRRSCSPRSGAAATPYATLCPISSRRTGSELGPRKRVAASRSTRKRNRCAALRRGVRERSRLGCRSTRERSAVGPCWTTSTWASRTRIGSPRRDRSSPTWCKRGPCAA